MTAVRTGPFIIRLKRLSMSVANQLVCQLASNP